MTEPEFWHIIDRARQSCAVATELPQRLIDILTEQSVDQIIDYDLKFGARLIEAYDDRLWAAAYAINDGCSDDSFADFCGWLISLGKE